MWFWLSSVVLGEPCVPRNCWVAGVCSVARNETGEVVGRGGGLLMPEP